jgi:hypothetical protein
MSTTAEAGARSPRRRRRLYPVPYYIGDGSGRMFLYVADIGCGFPRDGDNLCAFCHGDPCAERSGPQAEIAKCYARWQATYDRYNQDPGSLIAASMRREGFTCPLCEGRPT